MLWSKQYYALDVERWLAEHGADPLGGGWLRNHDWRHLIAEDVDFDARHMGIPVVRGLGPCVPRGGARLVDLDFAKHQLGLLLTAAYMHPAGQLPAYEWNFSDVNPPVHAWAALFGLPDRAGLQECPTGVPDAAFHKLMTISAGGSTARTP